MQNADPSINPKTSNLTLIGMAGVGKSVIGRRLAHVLRYEFIDIDERIEKSFNLRLQGIVDRFGEQKFLEIEEQTILELGSLVHTVISPGGSAIYSKRAMAFLKTHSILIFLDAPFETIEKQISNLDSRGIVWREKTDLKLLFQERKPLYEEYADMTVELSGDGNADGVVRKILKKIQPSEG
jgi:shikimate kinase